MNHRILFLAAVFLSLLPAGSARGQNGVYEKRVYTTARARPAAPVIDGDLGDACWEQVEWGTDFVQWEPTEGEPPTYQTAFKILYDDEALYIAYRAYDDHPQEIGDLLARRDWFPGDWVEINIDSRHDHRTAFSFTSSVSGTRGDEFISDDGNNWDGNWDPIWELKTRVDDQGWTAEVKIPLSQLRYGDREEHVWGFQIQRRLYRKEERSVWQPKSKDESGWVSRFGELRGIRAIRPRRQVELLPYTLADLTRAKPVNGNPYRDGSETGLAAGLDGKIGVTGDLTLDLTVNPDFGQVEADPSEVNLSAFETFFQEKRPFFIEGSNILDFRIAPSIAGGDFTSDNLFYSRRIGLRPHHYPDLKDGEYADVPDNTSILGAFKLTGKTRNGLSIGVMDNLTAEEKATIDFAGTERKETVEPFTNFFVGRAIQDFDRGNTRLGGMVTAVNRNINSPELEGLHRAAYSGGLDFFRYWNDKSWYVAANGAFSYVEGDEKALLETQTSSARYFQRPDNGYRSVDSTRTSLAGHAGSLRLARGGGQGNFRFETGAAWRSPGFETNDIGFLRRADEVNQFTWVGYSIRNSFSIFRRLGINANQWTDWDWGGTNLLRQGNLNFNANFRNNWNCGAGLTRALEYTSNTELRGGPSSKWPGRWDGNAWVSSDRNQVIFAEVGGAFLNADEKSRRYWESWVDFGFRPSNAVQVTLSPWYARNNREMQYVSTEAYGDENRYLFGRLHQETAGLTLRVDYTVTPNLTVQFYGAPFVSSGSYDEFKRITDPLAESYTDRFHSFAGNEIQYDGTENSFLVDEDANGSTDYSIENPDFNFREFNSNLVVRWEFQPGSLLYLVWSQARVDLVNQGQFSLRSDLDELFGVYPQNIFLIKVSKWFSL